MVGRINVGGRATQLWRRDYDAYGQESYGSSLAPNHKHSFRWNARSGYVTDEDSGMQLLGHRYHLPRLGRFLTPDPIGHEGGLNLYAYCDNGPLTRVDPDGLDWSWQQYWNDVGGVFKGYGTAAAGIVTGPVHLTQYYQANGFSPGSNQALLNGMWNNFSSGITGDRGAEGFGESFGTVLMIAAPGAKRIPLAFTGAGRVAKSGNQIAAIAIAAGTNARNYALGSASQAVANAAAVRFLGKGSYWNTKYKLWRSTDNLRQIRLSYKTRHGVDMMNFESRAQASGKFTSNGHLTIKP